MGGTLEQEARQPRLIATGLGPDLLNTLRFYVVREFSVSHGNERLKVSVIPNPVDEVLAAAYIAAKADGTLLRFFPEGAPGLTEFLALSRDGNRRSYACLVSREGSPGLDVAGFGLLTVGQCGEMFTKADASILYQRRYQRAWFTVPASREMLDLAFQDIPDLKAIFGTVPSANRAAIFHALRLGFQVSGELPYYTIWSGAPSAAVILSLERTRFYGTEQTGEAVCQRSGTTQDEAGRREAPVLA